MDILSKGDTNPFEASCKGAKRGKSGIWWKIFFRRAKDGKELENGFRQTDFFCNYYLIDDNYFIIFQFLWREGWKDEVGLFFFDRA